LFVIRRNKLILELSLLGILISCTFILLFNIYPGGIIVPVYFSFYLFQPKRLFATFIIAFISTLIYKLISKKFLLFGRRRFVFLIILSAFFSFFINILLYDYQYGFSAFYSIGFLIPGLLSNNIIKQGFLITLISLLTVSIVIFFIFKVFFYL
jgi:poly-gamma-glutamate biosynthesis protein PgsC/CapC